MDARRESEPTPMKNRTTVERKSERELVVTRTFNGPARLVFEAWTKPELFRQWWVPKSMGMSLLSCEMDVRVGGRYRLEFAHGDSQAAFFGTYKEVTPHSRLVWTNEESDEGSVTTVTFAEKGGKTLLVMHELYPSKEALDAAGTGAADAMGETFEQLDELLVTLGAPGRCGRFRRADASRPDHSHMLLLPERCQPEQPRVLVGLRVHREQLGSLNVDPGEDLVQRLRAQPIRDRRVPPQHPELGESLASSPEPELVR